MTPRLEHAVLLLVLAVPFSAVSANQNAAVKCSPNEDRVWVYDSPTSFNVEQKLRCGAPVQIIGRQDNFVKIEMTDGIEGFVPVENIPEGLLTQAPPAPAQVVMPRAPQPRISVAPSAPAPVVASSIPRQTAVVPVSTNLAAGPATAVATTAAPGYQHATPISTASTARTNTAVEIEPAAPMVAAAPAREAPAAPATMLAPSAAPARKPSVTATIANVSAVRKNPPGTNAAANDDESDDPSWVTAPKYESDDPACKSFFSSYGLSPGQFRWIIANRKKMFPSVCPAATPSMVDYVIIFTHDVSFYNYEMPTPVHLDGSFSDFNPIGLSAESMPRSEVDHSRREYVWVFHVQRGTYNPNTFSPHRHFQFSKIDSKYSQTLEDAFHFIEARGVDR